MCFIPRCFPVWDQDLVCSTAAAFDSYFMTGHSSPLPLGVAGYSIMASAVSGLSFQAVLSAGVWRSSCHYLVVPREEFLLNLGFTKNLHYFEHQAVRLRSRLKKLQRRFQLRTPFYHLCLHFRVLGRLFGLNCPNKSLQLFFDLR